MVLKTRQRDDFVDKFALNRQYLKVTDKHKTFQLCTYPSFQNNQ